MSLKLLLLLNFSLAAYLTGVIWTVQLVHYPGFAQVGRESFPAFHQQHSRRISWVVMGPMVLELLLALGLAWQGRSLGAAVWWALGLVGLIWAATFFISVPFHNRLARGYDYIAIDGLVRTNWGRTLAWTARAGLLGWLCLSRNSKRAKVCLQTDALFSKAGRKTALLPFSPRNAPCFPPPPTFCPSSSFKPAAAAARAGRT